ncbi:MAG: S9 family peptidase [Lewinella sp.]|jgi:dipeptidyl aminopeptidase/acylaminoacyl peptidase|uniref:S9 family peptidase n=1 Tax=Lewinella sp. TaxID=2004506 RepID=UPI003D6BC4F0
MKETSTTATSLPGDPNLPSSDEEIAALSTHIPSQLNYAVEDFFRLPEQTAFQLSPDGKYLAFLAPYQRRNNIHVRLLGEETAVRITQETDRSIGSFFWASDQRIVFVKDSGGNENYQLFAVDKDGANPRDLTPFPEVTIQIIDDLYDDENELIIGLNKNNPQLFEPYRINIHTGEMKQLAENTDPLQPIVQWLTDHQGRLRVAIRMVGGVNEQLLYRRKEEDAFVVVSETSFKESLSPLFFDFDDGDVIFTASNLERDKMVIIKYDLAEGKEVGEPVFAHPDVDVSSLHYSRRHKVLTEVSYTTWKQQHHFFDEARRARYEAWRKALGDYEITVVSKDKAEERFLLRTYSDRSLGAYYYYDETLDAPELVTEVSPWLKEEDMAPMKSVTYQSRDGLTIQGYLTLPLGHTGAPLPVVINPHGGPWVRDSWGYNPEAQLLAGCGYAVFQMNYRASTGYGRSFWEGGFKQWGLTMQDDITDGVNWLIAEGIADPAKVAIYGGSYGGYATLAGITFTPDLYTCAIDYVGVSNLFTFMQTIPPYWKPYLDMLYAMVGHPEEDEAQMRATSPVFHVDKIRTPLFVAQGANDPRVNIDESDQIVRQLRSRGIEVPYLVKYNEGHGFQNEENRFEFYRSMLGFLGKYLG